MPAYPQEAGETDVVFEVNWRCLAVDGMVQAVYLSTTPVTYTAGSPFTPYNQLTQEQVWGWINPTIDRAQIEADLQASIDKQKIPEVVTPPLPWSN